MSGFRRERDDRHYHYRPGDYNKVADRTDHGSLDVIPHFILEVAGIDRRWLRPPEHRQMAKCENRGQQNGSHRIDVLDGIQRHSPKHARGRIPTARSHPSVRRLMDADREQKCDDLENDVYDVQRRNPKSFDSNRLVPKILLFVLCLQSLTSFWEIH